MSMAWPVTLGEGDRSTIVMDISRRVLESQYARQGPAMPAPDIITFNLTGDVVLCFLLIERARVCFLLRRDVS